MKSESKTAMRNNTNLLLPINYSNLQIPYFFIIYSYFLKRFRLGGVNNLEYNVWVVSKMRKCKI